MSFYPKLKDFVLESYTTQGGVTRIEDCETVFAADGTPVNMPALMFEMESSKTAIVGQSPLFAPYVHHFVPIYTWGVDTMATDGIRIFVNPKFAQWLTWEGKIFVIVHEIMHCVLFHIDRKQHREHELFNIAGDYEINPLIVDTLPSFTEDFVKNEIHGLFESKYLNWGAEQIYDDMLENPTDVVKRALQKQQQQNDIRKQIEDAIKKAQGEGQPGEGEGQPGEGEGEGQPGGGQPGGSGGGSGGGPGGGPGGSDPGNTAGSNKGVLPNGKEVENVPTGPPTSSTGGQNGDPGGAGGIIDPKTGEKLAEDAGYDPAEMGGKASDVDAKGKWEKAAKELLDDLERKGGKGTGTGKGSALLSTLSKLIKGDVNWKALFSKFAGKALSPETYWKLGAKKYLSRGELRRGVRQKMDALRKVVVLIDVSGSMDDDWIKSILTEVNSIIFSKKVKEIIVAFFD